jgi:hypothetical protein
LYTGSKNSGMVNDHNQGLNDPYFLYFLANSLVDFQRVGTVVGDSGFTGEELREYVEGCRLLGDD